MKTRLTQILAKLDHREWVRSLWRAKWTKANGTRLFRKANPGRVVGGGKIEPEDTRVPVAG
jgi:hypothetical protein